MINYYPWAVYCESPPQLYLGEGGAKNEGLLYLQFTIDIHILNMFRLTVDIHFQNTLLLPLSLLLCSLLLPNCEGSHSVRLFAFIMFRILICFIFVCCFNSFHDNKDFIVIICCISILCYWFHVFKPLSCALEIWKLNVLIIPLNILEIKTLYRAIISANDLLVLLLANWLIDWLIRLFLQHQQSFTAIAWQYE